MNGILLDIETSDLKIQVRRDTLGRIAGGLVIGNLDYQNINLIIQSQKGEFKEMPTLGFGIENYLKSPEIVKQKFINELEKEIKSGGYPKAKVTPGDTLLEFDVTI